MEKIYSTTEQLAQEVKNLIDSYWKLVILEDEFIKEISDIFMNIANRGLAMRGLSFKAGFERKLGKKRIDELVKALLKIDNDLFKGLVK